MAAAAVEENKWLADYPELMKINFDEEHKWLHQFDNDLAGVSDSEVEACFKNLEQLSPTPTSDPSLDMDEVYDAMPVSFRLPGGSKNYPLQMTQEQHDKKSKRKVTKKEQQQDDYANDIVFQCSQADLLKMTIEYALAIFGLDEDLKVPTVELKEMVSEKPTSFSSKTTEELITDVMNSRLRGEIPTNGAMIFSLSQRISGWSITQRERPNRDRIDTFYRHNETKLKLRSRIEVMKFILYEYPRKPRLSQKRTPKDDSSESKKRKRMDTEPSRGFL